MSQLESSRKVKGGWTAEETDRLFEEAREAGQEGRSIKSVFDKVARITGRKPNSIRNYYYLKLKENHELAAASFVPFTEEEIDTLIKTMLIEQGKGRSVRSIAFSMGNGDKKAMLRYQNKYRSLLRGNPEKIRIVMDELEEKGIPVINPFENRRTRAAHRTGKDVAEALSELMEYLPRTGVDGESFLLALSSIVFQAAGSHADMSTEKLAAQNRELRKKVRELTEENKKSAMEMARQLSVASELEARLGAILAINRSFLSLSGMERISGLPDYVCAIEKQL